MAGGKTYVACRPGMKQAMEKAFAGIDVEVDDNLTTDYEFRERELSFAEALEAEVDKSERFEADPKNAKTFVVPLAEEDHNYCDFLAVRVGEYTRKTEVVDIIKRVKVIYSGDDVNSIATAGAVRAELKKANIDVYSVSVAEGGLTWPDFD
jgi:hypothetical protein